MRIKHIHTFTIGLLACLFLLVGCTQEEEFGTANGKLRLSIGQVSTQTSSRAVPADLPNPLAANFQLKAQRTGTSIVTYEGPFQSELELSVGTYDITASHGENPIIGRDTPYYIGTTKATVRKDESSAVTITCKVGNALASVRFGSDDTELQRFHRFYKDFGLLVQVGDYSMPITLDNIESSIYFPAGSKPIFTFYGSLKADHDRVVSVPLSHNNIPETFQAADHAILTLTLPDPESAMAVNISKVEMETVNLDETIPLSWLPVASVLPTHQYKDGMLVGTNLTFTSSYPGMTWEARVTNAQDEIVRTVTGQGELSAKYTSSTNWPFLPAGKYKATYYLHSESGTNKVSSREFMVPAPQLEVKIGGYTSHSKYLDGDIEAANQCDGFTLYEPEVSVNIASSLIANSRYNYRMTYNFDGVTETASGNTQSLGEKKIVDARLSAYNLSANVQFGGQTITGGKDFFVTGIPFHFEPPTTGTWQKDGKVEDKDGFIQLGGVSAGSQTITYNFVAIPQNTRLNADYKFILNSAAIKTDFIFYVGEQTIASGGVPTYDNQTFEEIKAITTEKNATYVRVYNDRGGGSAHTDVYRVAFRYR